ncbi:Panacea domain-containing protein [Mycoplasma sp. Ms02]|uniref:Panacea domain-containing protein n=1 Tax=Mycoplasma sp. Ms02 TaxID=353851 RepID=UPI001C8A12DA|nr:type II toxin-antitoxin system antitoxin SocA domain-containing protein [Mycoplasma sp. Ms02]QZE12190.1 DUF4065 domain-containing protein [Mycoplasma sp. Ms02]
MKKNKYSYRDIALWFLSKESMTQKKLQKLCYYAHAWSLTLLDYSIIKDTKFQAWVHGPVSPELYRDYISYGWRDIPKNKKQVKNFDEKVLDVLESVWITYGDRSGNELSALTHSHFPWIAAREKAEKVFYVPSDASSEVEINEEDIKTFYRRIYSGV